ncbi:uncharacterized protein LOC129903657 [Solanum dulcamara]|uniref:uncharacterized protein LOC129903657 n=1 Tax=Solanum dulcamara TaxID=45834 RepID=UPI002485143B|nr:uncharacterized protein LOC129903657 [Solanum dulcamara]
MDSAIHNPNNKIWLFWNQDVDCSILDEDEQQVQTTVLLYLNARRLEGDQNIATTACDYFEKIFTGKEEVINEDILRCIPNTITDQQNQSLNAMPTKVELKEAIFSLSDVSIAGTDGINGKFFHTCWDIISEDLLNLVKFFFCGHSLPKFISHACLVLLPKVDHLNKLSDFRLISLSNFTNKVISKVLCLILAPILPQLISENQSGFVQEEISLKISCWHKKSFTASKDLRLVIMLLSN